MRNESKITTELAVDDALEQDQDFIIDADDRQYIDNQNRGAQLHIVSSLISGAHGTYYRLDGASAAIAPGDVFCATSVTSTKPTVRKAVSAATANVNAITGVAITGCAPGGLFIGALKGMLSPLVTGLPATKGYARAKGDGRCEWVATLSAGDLCIGTVDLAGWLTLNQGLQAAGGGWQTAISVSFAGASDPGLSADGTYTLAGLTVKRENAANDRVAMSVGGSGIVISPTTSQYLPSNNVRTAPLLWFSIPVVLDWTTALRISIRIASSSQSAFDNGHNVYAGIDSDSTAYATWCGQGTNGALGRLFDSGVAVNGAGQFTNRAAGGSASTGSFVVTCEIPQLLKPQLEAMTLYRDGVAAWPDFSTLSPVVGVSSLRSPFDAINPSNVAVSSRLGIIIAADAPGGAPDAYTVTVSDLRVDYRN